MFELLWTVLLPKECLQRLKQHTDLYSMDK